MTSPSAGVVSVQAPSPAAALEWMEVCRGDDVWVSCFRPASLPGGISRLRLTARTNPSEIDKAVDVILRHAPRG